MIKKKILKVANPLEFIKYFFYNSSRSLCAGCAEPCTLALNKNRMCDEV